MIGRTRHRRGERGAIAIVAAMCLTLLCVVAAMVLDFGLVKVDRQVDKSAADSAVLAGLHAMDFTSSSSAKPYVGVCAALRFLKANGARFSSLSESTGWSKADGTSISGNACTNTALQQVSCSSTDKSTWARYDATQSVGALSYTVRIQNGYNFSDSGSWKEDSLAATTGDHASNPCMDMELTINQTRQPGLGSLATSGNLATGIRTVGRAQLGDGGVAPAMLLLKRTGCAPNPLQIGGNNSYIHVQGFAGGSINQPGTIHSDDDGGGCASSGGNQIFAGANVADSIVAYAAPLLSNTSSPDPAKPGLITSVYGNSSSPNSAITRDSFADVYGASGLNSGAAGGHNEASGRSIVTRQPVDYRYRAAVGGIIANAAPYFALGFANQGAAHNGSGGGWGYATCGSNGTIAANQIDAYDSARQGLFVNCSQVTAVPNQTISQWRTIVFSGSLKTSGGASIKLPDANKVYITGAAAGATSISGTGSSFQMNTTNRIAAQSGFADGSKCVSTPTGSARGLLVVKNGSLGDNGLFRACDTTVVLMGNDSAGCVPTYDIAANDLAPTTYPTHTPCASSNNSAAGTGQLSVNGDVDWTAPNNCTIVTDTTCDGSALAAGDGWSNVNGPEDLALWTESAAYGSINARIGGTSAFNLRGVFMSPNFDPLTVGGGAGTTLLNAQFIATSLGLNGGAQLTMTVDPNAAVRMKTIQLFGLVR